MNVFWKMKSDWLIPKKLLHKTIIISFKFSFHPFYSVTSDSVNAHMDSTCKLHFKCL